MPIPAQSITWEMLLHAYANGYFPMAEDAASDELHWFYPEERGIIPLDGFHVPKSLAKFIKKSPFTLTTNHAFSDVIRGCQQARGDTWINARIVDLYIELHQRGFAHSVEVWVENEGRAEGRPALSPAARSAGNSILVGGLYGVSFGGAFFGESMFSLASNASKVALVHLVELMRNAGYTLLDTQFTNDHLQQFGVVEIPRAEYLVKLEAALKLSPGKCF